MRRLLRVRMLVVLLALALIPAATLPFAARLRKDWATFWEPKAEPMELVYPEPFVDGYGSATPLLSSTDTARIVRPKDREVILLRRPREALPTDSGTADDYARALAGSEAIYAEAEEAP